MASGCLSLVAIAAVLMESGAMTPHIGWRVDSFFLRAEVDENEVLSTDVEIELENEAFTSFTVTDVSAEMPGLRLLPGKPSEATVEGNGYGQLTGRVVITDCAAVPYEPQPVRFTYETWMGTRSAEVTWDSWRLTGPEESMPIAWQRGLADKVCNDAVNPDWP
nr:hypothetical protein GCM10020093_032580 [Planobispora longispora]